MRNKKPDHVQPVLLPKLPAALESVPLREPTEQGSVDSFLEVLVDIALAQLRRERMLQSDQPHPLKKAA